MTRRALRVLLIEDNPDDADLLREALADAGADVRWHCAETLADGVARLAEAAVDVVLLDLSLPDSHGLGTLTRALAHAAAPVVVLTGLHDEMLGAAAVQAGAQDYVIKGQLDGDALQRCMRYAIERHRLLGAQREDAEVWATLAHAGEALLGAAPRDVLNRLCTAAATALTADSARLWVLDRAGAEFVLGAAHPPALPVPPGAVPVPRQALDAVRRRDGRSLRWLSPRQRHTLPVELMPGEGVDHVLCLALARGEQLIGVLLCGYTSRPPRPARTRRVARGLMHLATLALSNARLVDALEQSNTINTYFAATMAHELRTTLFSVTGCAEMLLGALADGGNAAEAQRLARTIGDRARDGSAVIQAALEVSGADVRPPGAGVATVRVADLLAQLAADIQVPADKAAVRMDWVAVEDVPGLRTDAVKLHMLLKNLITNAIKFTDSGSVCISAAPAGDGVQIRVTDTGVGIDPAQLPHLFEPFRQLDGAQAHRGGLGLGLYIVGRLAALLGARVEVDSRPGAGTTFTVTVPASAPSAAAAPLRR